MEITWEEIIKFKWFKRLYVLYIFGFVIGFRPSLPFHYEFFINYKNLSKSEIIEDIFPVLFYSNAVLLLPVFFLADLLNYNPFIITSSLTGIVATCLHIWTSSLTELQVAQVFCGCMSATEIAYYVSVYCHSDVTKYQRLTAYIRAAPLGGKIIANLLAQLLISQEWLNYQQLYYFDLSAFIVATIISIFLPPVDHQKSEKTQPKISSVCSNFVHSFPNKYVIKWSIWSIFSICGYTQIILYIQPLWRTVQDDKNLNPYNGSVGGVYAIFALAGTLLGGFANFNWKFKGDLILSFTSLVQAFMLIFISQLEDVFIKCMFYVIFGFMFHFIVTILSAEIVKFLNKGCFGLIFGFIALVAAILSSGMACLFNEQIGFQLEPQDLFMVYGYYHLALSVLFIVVGLSYWFAKHTYQ